MNTHYNIDYDKQIQELQTKKLQQELEIKIKGLITEKHRIKQEIKNLKGQLKQLTITYNIDFTDTPRPGSAGYNIKQ